MLQMCKAITNETDRQTNKTNIVKVTHLEIKEVQENVCPFRISDHLTGPLPLSLQAKMNQTPTPALHLYSCGALPPLSDRGVSVETGTTHRLRRAPPSRSCRGPRSVWEEVGRGG